ncbi:acyl-CoA-binding domain-containing protein 5 [Cylas formicarius]|uniref:acyl-CoA-binding domain-containing protein 5 n=1 Tax=Cylas formicarius TaxID=197179 RepID=UPI00295866F2|nr:acyl-CoA-binding domain-containing protein 5 [Cylas formicarius]
MTTEEKFNAAVNVIRSLPKNGSYQPSNELMLRFYAYFKQATLGPCTGSRPAFWDVIGRAKYDAWKKLGDMSSAEAMAKYVDELHAIVETMSYSDKVANFLEAPTNELDSINFDDLELVAGDVLERVRSQPNSPLASREGSPIRFISSIASSRSASPALVQESDHSDEEYIDTIENPEPRRYGSNEPLVSSEISIPNGTVQHISRSRTRSQNSMTDISQEVSKTIQNLKSDIEKLKNQIHNVEQISRFELTRWRLFGGLSPHIVIFMVVWPFIANLLVNRWVIRKK